MDERPGIFESWGMWVKVLFTWIPVFIFCWVVVIMAVLTIWVLIAAVGGM